MSYKNFADGTSLIINSVIRATETVFAITLGCAIERRNLRLLGPQTPGYSLAAVIRLTGCADGCIGLSFSDEAAREIVHRLVGADARKLKASGPSAVAELCSVIAGTARSLHGGGIEMSLPEILPSGPHGFKFPQRAIPMAAEFDSDIGSFMVFFALWRFNSSSSLQHGLSPHPNIFPKAHPHIHKNHSAERGRLRER